MSDAGVPTGSTRKREEDVYDDARRKCVPSPSIAASARKLTDVMHDLMPGDTQVDVIAIVGTNAIGTSHQHVEDGNDVIEETGTVEGGTVTIDGIGMLAMPRTDVVRKDGVVEGVDLAAVGIETNGSYLLRR